MMFSICIIFQRNRYLPILRILFLKEISHGCRSSICRQPLLALDSILPLCLTIYHISWLTFLYYQTNLQKLHRSPLEKKTATVWNMITRLHPERQRIRRLHARIPINPINETSSQNTCVFKMNTQNKFGSHLQFLRWRRDKIKSFSDHSEGRYTELNGFVYDEDKVCD